MKNTARQELECLDLELVIKYMTSYSAIKLMGVDIKQLEGLTSDDFVSETITKALEGRYKWETAAATDFTSFLFGCLRCEISNFLIKIKRRSDKIVDN